MNFQPRQSNALLKSSVCFYALLDQQGKITFANDYFLQSFPNTSSFYDVVSSAEQIKLSKSLITAFAKANQLQTIEFKLRVPNNDIFNTKWDLGLIEEDGNPYAELVGVARQIDKPASYENTPAGHSGISAEVLEDDTHTDISNSNSDGRYRLLFYKNPLPMWIYNLSTLQFIEVNEAAVEHYGYTREEFLSMSIKDIRSAEEQQKFLSFQKSNSLRDFVHKGYWKHLKKNGEMIDVQITAHPMDYEGVKAKLVLADDITEQIRAELKLIKSNERYDYASKATFDAIWDWDLKTNYLYWGEGFKILFGYEIENQQNNIADWSDHIHPDEKERVTRGVHLALKNGETNWTDEYKYIKADGTYAYVTDRGIIIRDEQGEAVRMIGAMQDSTIRKVNEQQLQKINLQLLRQQKERELTASILRSLSEKELLNDALEDILRKLTLFYQFEIGEVWVLNMDRNRIELRQKWYASKPMAEFYDIHHDVTYKARDNNQLGKEWNEDEIIFIEDLPNYESFIRKEGARKLGLTKSLGVPIMFKEQTIALFSFFGKKEFGDKDKIKLYFEALSLQLGIDIQRKKTEEELNKFFALSPDILSIIDFDGSFKKINAAFSEILGFKSEEIMKMNIRDLVHADDIIATKEQFRQLEKGNTIYYFENRYRTKNGNYRWLAWASAPLEEDRVVYATAKDITDKKESDSKINRILESISDGFFTVDKDGILLYWNQRAEKILNLQRQDVLGKKIFEIFKGITPKKFFTENKEALENNLPIHFEEFVPAYDTWFEVNAYPYEGILSVFFRDVTERKKSEEIIRVSNERYEVLAKATKDAIWDWNLLTNEVSWNEGLKTHFNYDNFTQQAGPEWGLDKVHPDDRERVGAKITKHIEDHETNWETEFRFRCADGTYKYIYERAFTLYDDKNTPIRMIGSMQDLTEIKASELALKELNLSLEKRAAQLAASNAELERFAYVASHDLQEPLRMVSSFLQLIGKKYKDKLDAKGHEYIGFAVDGAERMKGLILDLLEYSRVNTRKEKKEKVDLNEVAADLLHIYQEVIREADGKIIIDELPVVMGSKLQLMRLFQNLIGNALKYRSTIPPEICITVEESGKHFQFAIADNGIGIEKRFFDKIFIIFQRLHNKNEYSGTGIGLAICKKIIELHAGKIWVDSEPGKGSTFYFTLPKL
jgi:PAS domain S-box-containing protein